MAGEKGTARPEQQRDVVHIGALPDELDGGPVSRFLSVVPPVERPDEVLEQVGQVRGGEAVLHQDRYAVHEGIDPAQPVHSSLVEWITHRFLSEPQYPSTEWRRGEGEGFDRWKTF